VREATFTAAERRLRGLLWAHAALCAAFTVGYIAGRDTSTLGFISNSVAKDGLFTVLSVMGAANVRRRGWTAPLLALAYAFLVIGHLFTLAFGGAPGVDALGVQLSGTTVLLAWIAVDVLLALWLVAWWMSAVRARHGLRYLNAIAFHGLVALADVLIGGTRERVPPAQVARNVDGYLAGLRSSGKWRVRAALTLLALLPPWLPLPLRAPAARERWLRRRFLADLEERRVLAPLRPFWQALIRTAAQMTYLGYYGDRASWPSIGYVPFADRPGGRPPRESDHAHERLPTLGQPPRGRQDVIVVGSGAAGSILAYRLAEGGRRVLLLERGPHVDSRDFTDDEVAQYLRLYNEGALQLSTDFRLQVLQGMCVGGGTTINNGVCLDPPAGVLDVWAQRGIDRAGLERAVKEVRTWLGVAQIPERIVSEGARRFERGALSLGLPGQVRRVDTNMRQTCLGAGYCNIGCGYGQRHAALDEILPSARQGLRGSVDVLADFHVQEILHEGDRAIGVAGVHGTGTRVAIHADAVVVAAGALHSSWLLQRSGLGGDRAGAKLYFNVNSPVTADFPEPVDTFAGIQMTHMYLPPGEPPFVLESWFNTPATQALAMPGWFERHYENMLRFRHMAAAGALVGTTKPASVSAGRRGPNLSYAPAVEDLHRVVEGVKLIGRIFLAAGALRVMPATFAWREIREPDQLDELDSVVRDNADILLSTAHPQGGNPVGERREGGVVDAGFRLHELRNVWVCDASVFPTSVTVNPQLTVMAMAQYAAPLILAA
jgi:choline dehydrogenase-like flavoprotein